MANGLFIGNGVIDVWDIVSYYRWLSYCVYLLMAGLLWVELLMAGLLSVELLVAELL